MPYQPVESESDFRRRIKIGETTEGLHLDFKRELNRQKGPNGQEAQAELCRDIAQFANTEGGTLLIGVDEKQGPNGHKVASEIIGLKDVDGDKRWIEQAITNYLVPNTIPHPIETITLDEGPVLAINVPPSIHLVALWHRDERGGLRKGAIEYLYRTNHGKEWMNPDAAERHLMDGSRATKLAVKALFSKEDVKDRDLQIVPAPLYRGTGHRSDGGRGLSFLKGYVYENELEQTARLKAVSDTEFEVRFAGGETITVPYAFVEATWITTDMRPAIALKVRIVKDGKTLALEPIEAVRRDASL